jgi:hypothetical protein
VVVETKCYCNSKELPFWEVIVLIGGRSELRQPKLWILTLVVMYTQRRGTVLLPEPLLIPGMMLGLVWFAPPGGPYFTVHKGFASRTEHGFARLFTTELEKWFPLQVFPWQGAALRSPSPFYFASHALESYLVLLVRISLCIFCGLQL